jgi:hypothetical protein
MTPEAVEASINAFLSRAREQSRDGLTWAEFGSLTLDLLKLAIVGLEGVSVMTGPAKRAAALGAVGLLFDAAAGAAVPWAAWPLWAAARPIVRVTLLAFAAGLLESLLPTVRATA